MGYKFHQAPPGEQPKPLTPTDIHARGVSLEMGGLQPKQRSFCTDTHKYVGYGGARGGGKSYAVRWKAKAGAMKYPGIRILIVRRQYPDLENSIIEPMIGGIPPEIAGYNAQMHMLRFYNGSRIKFGHYSNEGDSLEYQGKSLPL